MIIFRVYMVLNYYYFIWQMGSHNTSTMSLSTYRYMLLPRSLDLGLPSHNVCTFPTPWGAFQIYTYGLFLVFWYQKIWKEREGEILHILNLFLLQDAILILHLLFHCFNAYYKIQISLFPWNLTLNLIFFVASFTCFHRI